MYCRGNITKLQLNSQCLKMNCGRCYCEISISTYAVEMSNVL